MKQISGNFRSVLFIQLFLINNSSTLMYLVPKKTAEQPGYSKMNDYSMKKDLSKENDGGQQNINFGNQPHMLSIDLSQLAHRSALIPTTQRKAAANMLAIDISVLSRKPDPTLPIIREFVMTEKFNPLYDRLPVIEKSRKDNSKLQKNRMSTNLRTDNSKLHKNRMSMNSGTFPVYHFPFNIIALHHSILTNKKQRKLQPSPENEKIYTADFLTHLLHQLSSKSHIDLGI